MSGLFLLEKRQVTTATQEVVQQPAAAQPALPAEKVVEPVVEQSEQEAEASLSAGFNRIRPDSEAAPPDELVEAGDTKRAPKEKPDKVEVPAATAAAATPAAPVDPVQARLDAQDARMRKIEGRQGDLNAVNAQLKTALEASKATAKAGAAAPSAEQITAAPIGGAKWTQLKSDFPEWAEAIEEAFASQAAEFKKSAPAVDVDGIRKEISTSSASTIDQARQLARLDIKHEDWEKTLIAPEFAAWGFEGGPNAQEQAESARLTRASNTDPQAARAAAELQHQFARKYPQWWADKGALMDSTNASDAIRLLDAFKQHQATVVETAATGKKQTSRLAAAAPLKGSAVGGPRLLNDEEGLNVGFNRVRKMQKA